MPADARRPTQLTVSCFCAASQKARFRSRQSASHKPARSLIRTLWLVLLGGIPWLQMAIQFPAAAQAQPQSAPAAAKDETWQVLYIGQQRVGYAHISTRTVERDGRPLILTDSETHMTVKRFGQELKIQTHLRTEETEDGDLLKFDFEMQNPPAGSTRTVGKVVRNRLVLETTTAGRTDRRQTTWQPGIKSPAYQDRLLRENPPGPGETRTFETYLPELGKTTRVKLHADQYRGVELHDGKQHQLLKVRITQSVLPTLVVQGWMDRNGELLKTETDFIGTKLTTYTVPKEVALEELAGAELDLAVNTLVPVDRIKNAHETRKVVYRITMPGNDPLANLSTGPTQAVRRIDPETAELTVTALKPRPNAPIVRANPEFLAATRFLQSTDYNVIKHARRASANETDPARIALAMERYVHEKLAEKNFSTALASAAEVAKNLEGDCTEHAVLLAAMLRVKRIPSRISVGLVYIESRSSFGGHMWTEAYLGGQWVPLDATLGQGGIGAAHIKMADSSFSDEAAAPVTTFLPLINVLGTMKIEVTSAE